MSFDVESALTVGYLLICVQGKKLGPDLSPGARPRSASTFEESNHAFGDIEIGRVPLLEFFPFIRVHPFCLKKMEIRSGQGFLDVVDGILQGNEIDHLRFGVYRRLFIWNRFFLYFVGMK